MALGLRGIFGDVAVKMPGATPSFPQQSQRLVSEGPPEVFQLLLRALELRPEALGELTGFQEHTTPDQDAPAGLMGWWSIIIAYRICCRAQKRHLGEKGR